MKRLSQLSTLLLTLGIPLSTAFAQGEEVPATSDAPSDETTANEPQTAAAPVVDESGTYPTAVIQRPLTLPKGMIQLVGQLNHVELNLAGAGMGNGLSATGLAFGAAYGVTDKIQLSASTVLILDPDFESSEVLNMSAHYLAYDTDKLDVAVGLLHPLDFSGDDDVVKRLVLEAPTRFLATEQFSVYAGNGLLAINLDPSVIDLNLNLGGAFQASEQLAVFATTRLASIAISGDNNETSSLSDFIPLNLGGLFAISEQLDIQVAINFPRIEDAVDFYIVSFGANFRI